MKSTGTRVKLLAWLIALALSGLVVVQAIMLQRAIKAEEEAFRRNAVIALSKAADGLLSEELFRVVIAGSLDPATGELGALEQADSIIAGLRRRGRDDTVVYRKYRDTLVSSAADSTGPCSLGVGERFIQIEFIAEGDIVEESLDNTGRGPRRVRHSTSDSAEGSLLTLDRYCDPALLDPAGLSDTTRAIIVQAALNTLESQERKPIRERLDLDRLDSAVSEALLSEGIELACSFGVIDRAGDSLELIGDGADSAAVLASPYRTRLFPHDVLSSPKDLAAYFPDRQRHILGQLLPVAAPAAVFLVAIAAGFAYTIRVILGQQRLARRLTDFINNMTHEFKTPISTIQLASEALARDDVHSDRARVERFNRMIADENRRMRRQVDKILQMASIEEGALEINREPLDLHSVVTAAVEATRLNVAGRRGELSCKLNAPQTTIAGDPVHLGSVVANLLDNACKYSPEAPRIEVATEQKGDCILLRVADRGIGIAQEDLDRVFDKYFRVPTGDRHDVKGFGLGLSYVKLVVEALGGEINLRSALGKGTEVTVSFKLIEAGA